MRKNSIPPIVIVGFIIVVTIIAYIVGTIILSSSQQAKKVVQSFYTFEQDGNFAESWELFHPYMKEKFSQGSYIQDRAHVFMGHFGAETFTYEIGNKVKMVDWKMAEDSTTFNVAYQFIVTQKYKGKYGSFGFVQEVYVVKDKGKWQILWDYNL